MTLAKNIVQAMKALPVQGIVRSDGHPCALAPFGCSGRVSEDRVIVILRDGTPLGTCANYVRHTTIVRDAGSGSDVQQLFTWLLGIFNAHNAGRPRGSKDPINTLDLRQEARA